MGLFTKNEVLEYKNLASFSDFIDSLLLKDHYVSRKEYYSEFSELKETVNKLSLMEDENVLLAWCRNNKVDYKKLKELINKYNKTAEILIKHNDEYVSRHLYTDKQYLDSVLEKDDPNIKLDEEQRRVVLADEDYTLVIAGAGAGKTTTIEAKVKYLVDKKNVSPDRILIVSFTKKATDELRDRFHRLEIPVNIATFHSIGNTIIKENDNVQHKIVEQGFMYNVIKDYLSNKLLEDEFFVKKVLLFFASYLNMPFEGSDVQILKKTLAANDITTIKADVTKLLDEYHEEQTKQKITINDERVRSLDECRIANFLYIKGVQYIYEPVYQWGFEDTTKPYCPDFLIKYGDQEIYLEHFGISESGENDRFTASQLEEYKKHINDKIKLHRKHKTKLIYTFSKYNDGRDLITHLEEILLKEGIKFDAKNDIEIYKQLAKKAEDKYFTKLIQLLCNFINRFKVSNFDPATKFDDWLYTTKSERTKLFLQIAQQCFKFYEIRRMEEKAIDFEDMINNAANILDKRIADGDMLPYDYIFVDEYQDISLQRFDLCERLSKASEAKIIAVGDDWQSIFRFSGAQIDLFTKFEEKMGYANVQKITRTYRNSQELIDIAGGFVMENQKQIKKDLKSSKSIKDPVILMSYDDSQDRDDQEHGPLYRMTEAVEKALDDIVAKSGIDSSVMLIGRYNFDGRNLTRIEGFFTLKGDKLISDKYPKLDISFMTAHASKGLGRDNVIVVNGKDDILGFPSKIEDDPVMKLVIKNDEAMDFEEERRLFYVALTRTKNRVYIVTPQLRPSKFILEIKDKFTNVILRGTELNPQEDRNNKYVCPVCGYPLQRRQSNLKFSNLTKKLWICSNDPELCGFLTNDLSGNKYKFSIQKCSKCQDGYLIVKPTKGNNKFDRMLGCTNYKKDGGGCDNFMFPFNYTETVKDKYKNFKNELEIILDSIKEIYTNIPKFRFGYVALVDFLIGNETKTITVFKLNEYDAYGIYKDKKKFYVTKVLSAMLDFNILERVKDENNHENIAIKEIDLSEGTIEELHKAIINN